MATITTITYSSNTAITMDMTALASSATFVAGVESAEIDNTTNKYLDALVRGRFVVGTTPTVPCELRVYVWGSDATIGTLTIGTALDGTASAETLTTTSLGTLRLGAVVGILVNTSDTTYDVLPFSVAQCFGGIMPKFWGLYVTHNMTAALKTDAGNTDKFAFVGITYTDT